MRVSVKTITPAQAKKLLERNTNNRPLSAAHVKFLCGVIRRGEWKLNGDAIRYNANALVDGQHRLAACVETGISIHTVVVDGVDSGVFNTIDTGKNRGGADVLAINGVKNCNIVASGLRFIQYITTGSTTKMSNIQYEELYDRYSDISASCPIAIRCRKVLSASIGCATHCLFSRKDPQEADVFFDALRTGAGLKDKDPVLVLRDRLMRDKDSYTRLHPRQIAQLVIKAWNAHVSGEKVSVLRANGRCPDIKSALELK
jgi:hypothetical protein